MYKRDKNKILYPATIFVLNFLSFFTSAAYIQEHFRLEFNMEVNTMRIRVHSVCNRGYTSEHKQMREQRTKVVADELRFKSLSNSNVWIFFNAC